MPLKQYIYNPIKQTQPSIISFCTITQFSLFHFHVISQSYLISPTLAITSSSTSALSSLAAAPSPPATATNGHNSHRLFHKPPPLPLPAFLALRRLPFAADRSERWRCVELRVLHLAVPRQNRVPLPPKTSGEVPAALSRR